MNSQLVRIRVHKRAHLGWGLFAYRDLKQGECVVSAEPEFISVGETPTKLENAWRDHSVEVSTNFRKYTHLQTRQKIIAVPKASTRRIARGMLFEPFFANHADKAEGQNAKLKFVVVEGSLRLGLELLRNVSMNAEILVRYGGSLETNLRAQASSAKKHADLVTLMKREKRRLCTTCKLPYPYSEHFRHHAAHRAETAASSCRKRKRTGLD